MKEGSAKHLTFGVPFFWLLFLGMRPKKCLWCKKSDKDILVTGSRGKRPKEVPLVPRDDRGSTLGITG